MRFSRKTPFWRIRNILLPVGLVLASALPAQVALGGGDVGPVAIAAMADSQFDNPSYSPDGKWIAMSDGQHNGLYLHNKADNTSIQVGSSPSGAYAYNWSSDGKKLGFKVLVSTGVDGVIAQVPVVYDVEKRTSLRLSKAVKLAGVPSFSADGLIAYTVGQELRIADAAGQTIKTFEMDTYANLTPISPDGKKVAYNDSKDQMCILDIASGERATLTGDDNGYFNPVWSPDSSRLIVSTFGSQLKVVEIATGATYELGKGQTPSWAPDGEKVFFSRVDRTDGIKVNRADICQSRFDGTEATVLTQDGASQSKAARVSADGSGIVFVSPEGALYEAPLVKTKKAPKGIWGRIFSSQNTAETCTLGAATKISGDAAALKKLGGGSAVAEQVAAELAADVDKDGTAAAMAVSTQTQVTRTVPYIHQVYDTPDNFNGNWACGATSATMCLAYYRQDSATGTSPALPRTRTSVTTGATFAQIYTNNGHTYNIGSPDASGVTA